MSYEPMCVHGLLFSETCAACSMAYQEDLQSISGFFRACARIGPKRAVIVIKNESVDPRTHTVRKKYEH